MGNVDVWVDPEGARTHRAVLCRFKIELDGEIAGRARRPQAFRGFNRDGSRKNPREDGEEICQRRGGDLDVIWKWNEEAEAYPKGKEGVSGRRYSGRGVAGKQVPNTVPAPQDRGYGCGLDSEAKHRRDRLARVCELEKLKSFTEITNKQAGMIKDLERKVGVLHCWRLQGSS